MLGLSISGKSTFGTSKVSVVKLGNCETSSALLIHPLTQSHNHTHSPKHTHTHNHTHSHKHLLTHTHTTFLFLPLAPNLAPIPTFNRKNCFGPSRKKNPKKRQISETRKKIFFASGLLTFNFSKFSIFYSRRWAALNQNIME